VGARSVTMSTTYDMMTTYVGSDGQPKRQQVQGQVAGRVLAPPFQPNSGLSKRITPSFIANYTSPGAVPAKRSRETMSPEYDEYEPHDEPEAASRALSGSLGGSLLASQDIYAGSDGTATSQSGDFLRESKLKTGRNAVMDSVIDWDSSGRFFVLSNLLPSIFSPILSVFPNQFQSRIYLLPKTAFVCPLPPPHH
jgi:hypothetical protein